MSVQLFFDDEHRNYEVESLGVTMQLVPTSGTDRHVWDQGLALWRKRRGIRVHDMSRECSLDCMAGADHSTFDGGSDAVTNCISTKWHSTERWKLLSPVSLLLTRHVQAGFTSSGTSQLSSHRSSQKLPRLSLSQAASSFPKRRLLRAPQSLRQAANGQGPFVVLRSCWASPIRPCVFGKSSKRSFKKKKPLGAIEIPLPTMFDAAQRV